MNEVVVMLLAGGMGSRLNILAHHRAKPAVPFAGSYRIIDFTLSNAMRAGLGRVGVLTQYRPTSLTRHLGNGMPWDLWGKTRALRVLPPYTGQDDHDWYRGTSDAVYQNLGFIDRYDPSLVLILSGDHIYQMNYAEMLRFHRAKRADLTIASMAVPWEEASRFGLMDTDDDGRVVDFDEKPARPRFNLASMGVYVFGRAALERYLKEANAAGGHDFGQNVIPRLFEDGGRIFAYPFHGYWRDVGTLQSLWEANMDVLRSNSGIDLNAWRVRTNTESDCSTPLAAARISDGAQVRNSLVSRGCVVEGTVEHSVLSPGVRVYPGAVVRDSVLMHGTVVHANAVLDHVITDKTVHVGPRARLGEGEATPPNEAFPAHLRTGLSVVGKGARIPEGARVGRNCLVFPGVQERDIEADALPSGGTVRPRETGGEG